MRQQASLINQGQNVVLDSFNTKIANARAILEGMGAYQQDSYKGMQNTIGVQQDEGQRLFENDETTKTNEFNRKETAKNNEVARQAEIASVTGYSPTSWTIQNDAFLSNFVDENGKLKKEYYNTDFQALYNKAKSDGDDGLAEKYAILRGLKIFGNFAEYGKYLNEGNVSFIEPQITEEARQANMNNDTVLKTLETDLYNANLDAETKTNIANIEAGTKIYQIDKESDTTKYVADKDADTKKTVANTEADAKKTVANTEADTAKYVSDNDANATKYKADKDAEATKYTADSKKETDIGIDDDEEDTDIMIDFTDIHFGKDSAGNMFVKKIPTSRDTSNAEWNRADKCGMDKNGINMANEVLDYVHTNKGVLSMDEFIDYLVSNSARLHTDKSQLKKVCNYFGINSSYLDTYGVVDAGNPGWYDGVKIQK